MAGFVPSHGWCKYFNEVQCLLLDFVSTKACLELTMWMLVLLPSHSRHECLLMCVCVFFVSRCSALLRLPSCGSCYTERHQGGEA